MSSSKQGQAQVLPLSLPKPAIKAPQLDLSIFYTVFRRSIAIVVFLAVWELLPKLGIVDSAFLPPFSVVLQSGWQLILNGQLWGHLQASLIRSFSGFLVALVVAIPLGLAIGWYSRFSDLITPLLELFRNTAPLALLPVFILFLGIGEASKISLIIYACVWPILLNTISGVQQVDPLLIKSARTMGLTPVKLFRKVILPASVPTIFVGIRLAGGFSVLMLVAAEMIGAKAGLGYLINYSQFNFQIPEMFFGIIVITLVGLIFNYSLLFIERRLTGWKTGT